MFVLPWIYVGVQLLQDVKTGLFQLFLDLLLLVLIFDFHTRVDLQIKLAVSHLCKLLVTNVNEQLRHFAVCHDLLNCEDGWYIALNEDFEQVLYVGVLWHLEHDISAKL